MSAPPPLGNGPEGPPDNGRELRDAVRRYRARREKWKKEGPFSLARTIALMRSLGWMIVLPTVLGVFVGRWIDTALGSGMMWTVGLLILGLVLGCWLAWNKLENE
jgi:ATP synthase protein I